MFVGRKQELATLEQQFSRHRFEMTVIYGRRRIGKTALIDQFVANKKTLYFTALQRSSAINLHLFTIQIANFFELPTLPDFTDWYSALQFIIAQAKTLNERFVFVFDEFPYAALMSESLPSEMQIAIDHGFKDLNCMIILSGSNEGFMESEVLGYKSPLYGRRTSQIRLQPLNYTAIGEFVPQSSVFDCINYYATFGGTPYYLTQLDPDADFETNVLNLCFNQLGLLHEEPMMLLREELREPALYASVLQAIAGGSSTPKIIAEHSGVDPNSINKYLRILEELGLVSRNVPFGERPEKSRKALYSIKDPFFAYWYQFVAPAQSAIESHAGQNAARQLAFNDAFTTYVGQQFEVICLQWLLKHNGENEENCAVPFLATQFGKWWGNDPRKREQTDIDIVLGNPQTKQLLMCECKWRNTLKETEAVEALRDRVGLIRGYGETHLMFFSKYPISDATQRKYEGQVTFISAEQLFA